MKKFLQRNLPASWQKKWYLFKNPGIIDEVDIAWKLLAKNDPIKVMVDVGAHHGGSLEPFARKGWTIYAFEPDPIKLPDLQELAKKYPKLKIETIALGDKEEKNKAFFTSEVSSGIASLVDFHDSHVEAKKVEVKTLGGYCKQNKIDEISFLKSDTEGFDLQVLRGYDWTRPHPRVIVCEYDNHKTADLGYDLKTQADFLIKNSYRLIISEWHPLKEYGSGHKWWRFVSDATMANTKKSWGNIIAVKENDWESLLKITNKVGKLQ